jgi:hypothetical protein
MDYKEDEFEREEGLGSGSNREEGKPSWEYLEDQEEDGLDDWDSDEETSNDDENTRSEYEEDIDDEPYYLDDTETQKTPQEPSSGRVLNFKNFTPSR